MNSSDEDFQRSSASGTEPAGVTVPPRYGLPEEAGGENSVGVPMTRAGVRMMSGFAPPLRLRRYDVYVRIVSAWAPLTHPSA